MVFPNASEKSANMLVTQDISYFENLKQLIDYEPVDREDVAMRGMMASLGMVKGAPFEPDERMQSILNRAADVAWKMATAQRYERRIPGTRRYEDRQYDEGFIGGSEVFEGDTCLNLDARIAFFRFAYSSSPGMVVDMAGRGSKYPLTFKDADGNFLMGENSYRLHLPKGIPAENFWAVTLYGAPPSNYIGTNEGEGFFVILRLYSPGQAYFDKTWRPDDVVKIK